MIAQALKLFPWPWLTCFGLLCFVTLMVGVWVWVFQPSRRPLYEGLAQMPLEEDR